MAATLTDAGRAKLARVFSDVQQAMELALGREAIAMRTLAAENAPSPSREAELLSRGTMTDSFAAGAEVGTPEEGRFLKEGGMLPVQEAIAADPIVEIREGDRVVFGTGSQTRLNERTGFSWGTRRRGTQGPTFPFNRNLIGALENGGLVWRVTPRTDALLEPEPGLTASEMLKTVQPIRMFARARATRRPIAVKNVTEAVRRAARRAE